MTPSAQKELLRQLPSISDLMQHERTAGWQGVYPAGLITDCLRAAVDALRQDILADRAGRCSQQDLSAEAVLDRAEQRLQARTQPNIRPAINATGIVLHTALGRAVWPGGVVDGMTEAMKGYVTLAIDRETGLRSERHHRVEALLCELTGAEAATVVNNNAAATLLSLAALCAGREVIVSRGQLIEIGGSFRLPDVMAQSGSTMVEVGTTNRTHLRDYARAIGEQTAAIFRAHPSNYRVVGFSGEPGLDDLVGLAHEHDLTMIDDLGAGALVDLEQFNLPHEPTMGESIAAGADVVLASGDKLIGASQAGVIVGRTDAIDRIRRHPLARAVRADKACLMVLERTLMLFRDMDRLQREHPTYRMLVTPVEQLRRRAETLIEQVDDSRLCMDLIDTEGFLGSGSLPMHALADVAVSVRAPDVSSSELARRLRMHDACLFTRLADDAVLLHMRTVTDDQLPAIARALTDAAH